MGLHRASRSISIFAFSLKRLSDDSKNPITPKIEYEAVVREIIDDIKKRSDPKAVAGMARFGIQTSKAFGVSVLQLRHLARRMGKNHYMAEQLRWTATHEARILAGMVHDPARVSEDQMEKCAAGFDSWDFVDGSCGNLFPKTELAVRKEHEWSKRKEEYVKRAGFVLMAELAVHDKKASDETFLDFLPVLIGGASDERNFVK